MSSPITNYADAKPPSTQIISSDFRPTDNPNAPESPASTDPSKINTAEPFGTLTQLPLVVQAAFRRKLATIIALQLATVAGIVVVLEFTCPQWLVTSIIDNKVIYGFATLLVVILLALHFVRDRFPFNWVLLTVLTADLGISFAALDATLYQPVLLVNCVFTWIVVVILVLTAGWTQDAVCDCRRMTAGWTPPISASLDTNRKLTSPFLTGFMGFLVASGVIAVVNKCFVDLQMTSTDVLISFLVQFFVSVWFFNQIHTMASRVTPDAYMSGVIYVYADTLVVVVIIGAAFLCAMCADGSGADACVGCLPIVDPTTTGDHEQV